MNDNRPSLDQLLANLPRDVAPPPGVWPAIAPRLQPAARRPRAWLLAASLAGTALLASVLTLLAVDARRQGVAPEPATTTGTRAPRPVDFGEPRDPAYVAAHHAMEQAFQARLGELDPVTRAKIEASLVTIHKAREDIRAALAGEPSNPVLGRLLQSTMSDEFDLYENVVRSTDPHQTRT